MRHSFRVLPKETRRFGEGRTDLWMNRSDFVRQLWIKERTEITAAPAWICPCRLSALCNEQ